jgi:hypothetical protein
VSDEKRPSIVEQSQEALRRGLQDRPPPLDRDHIIPPRGTPAPDHDVNADRRAVERGLRNDPGAPPPPYPNPKG